MFVATSDRDISPCPGQDAFYQGSTQFEAGERSSPGAIYGCSAEERPQA